MEFVFVILFVLWLGVVVGGFVRTLREAIARERAAKQWCKDNPEAAAKLAAIRARAFAKD